MSFRITAVLVALPALLAGLFIALPAEAAVTYSSYVTTTNVAISPDGNGKVYLQCRSSYTCKGSITFVNDSGTPRAKSYTVDAKSAKYVPVAMHTDAPVNPNGPGAVDNGDFSSKSGVVLRVKESAPKSRVHDYTVTTETLVTHQQIAGSVTGPALGSNVTNVTVELLQVVRGGNTQTLDEDEDLSNGYSFTVRLGDNNSPAAPYALRITGRDQDGNFRSWFWRGTDNQNTGGARYIRDATPIRATKYNNYDADFRYGSISGSAPSGTEITVAGPPPSYAGGSAVRRELDLPGCANVYGHTTANTVGRYQVDFLPANPTDKRYMVGAKKGSIEYWNNSFGSCFDVMEYSASRDNLIAVGGSVPAAQNFTMTPSNNNLLVDGTFSGFKPTTQGDRWVRLRERVPGLPILDAPVVAEGFTNTYGNRVFSDLAPGNYWVEVGRRTGCSDWFPSKFPNNKLYFKGLDRSYDNWKAFTTLSSLPGSSTSGLEYTARHADPNPATSSQQGHVPRGYRGWMYRGQCKAYGAGSINMYNVVGRDTGDKTFKTSKDSRGAIVKGHVSRVGGKTNKEMMVRLSSSSGTRVVRTDATDSSGNFYVAGLASGSWTISVNSDSWRGIGRTFTGRHSISVHAGHTYSAGTLRFKS